MSIKISKGKLELHRPFEELYHVLDQNGFELLPISFLHTLRVGELPYHHNDPFDRVIIAQAQEEKLIIVSRDQIMTAYDVSLLWQHIYLPA